MRVGTYFPGRGTIGENCYLIGYIEGRVRGSVKQVTKVVVEVLEKRLIRLSDDDRKRIRSCTDLETANAWLDRALEATSAEDFFNPPAEKAFND
ncbi:hypothetical protein [Streptomyces sp. CAU 1734]|uniref:hypothetical protein n=1 Tax=Streptomyces sp. CAU 1734 TaxID=3140360 RepID=UPI00325FFCB7